MIWSDILFGLKRSKDFSKFKLKFETTSLLVSKILTFCDISSASLIFAKSPTFPYCNTSDVPPGYQLLQLASLKFVLLLKHLAFLHKLKLIRKHCNSQTRKCLGKLYLDFISKPINYYNLSN